MEKVHKLNNSQRYVLQFGLTFEFVTTDKSYTTGDVSYRHRDSCYMHVT
jgi:hypothetical protein